MGRVRANDTDVELPKDAFTRSHSCIEISNILGVSHQGIQHTVNAALAKCVVKATKHGFDADAVRELGTNDAPDYW